MAMVRREIIIDEETDRLLREEADRRGMSEGELIAERFGKRASTATLPALDETTREDFLKRLRETRKRIKSGPGSGRKFDRGEIYEHRIQKARPDRH